MFRLRLSHKLFCPYAPFFFLNRNQSDIGTFVVSNISSICVSCTYQIYSFFIQLERKCHPVRQIYREKQFHTHIILFAIYSCCISFIFFKEVNERWIPSRESCTHAYTDRIPYVLMETNWNGHSTCETNIHLITANGNNRKKQIFSCFTIVHNTTNSN